MQPIASDSGPTPSEAAPPRKPAFQMVLPAEPAGASGLGVGGEAWRAAMTQGLRDPAAIRQRVEFMVRLLENSFTIPGTQRRAGIDAIVGLIPGIGDAISAAMGAYILWEARNLGMSRWQLWRMAGNLGIDTAIGAIPLLGDAFDFVYRSNTRNLRIIRKHLDTHHPATVTLDGDRP